ncbi:MAG TPA: N-formylglutamate deformylase [Roseiarcus sp.]|jgi:formiminoglutamase
MNDTPDWLVVTRQDAPLIVSVPHVGTDLAAFERRFVSPWIARKDADWHIDELYDFVGALGATIVRTKLSRSVIDVNRDPSGASLYPGQATTELCPATTFDGEPLYRSREAPANLEIEQRRRTYFDPYHQALRDEIARLRERHSRIVLFDAHSIRSRIPRLFEGELPTFNLGTNSGKSCAAELREAVRGVLAASGESNVVDGRFKGGWITRSFGRPEDGVHALQMELACRAYMREPEFVDEANWPTPFDARSAEPTRATLRRVLETSLECVGG